MLGFVADIERRHGKIIDLKTAKEGVILVESKELARQPRETGASNGLIGR